MYLHIPTSIFGRGPWGDRVYINPGDASERQRDPSRAAVLWGRLEHASTVNLAHLCGGPTPGRWEFGTFPVLVLVVTPLKAREIV